MDVISWVVGLVAGLTLVSLPRAIAVGVATSVGIRLYQCFIVEPKAWGDAMPQDVFGAIAMIAVTALLAYIGWVIRSYKLRSRTVEGS
jgi:hypothetical protein